MSDEVAPARAHAVPASSACACGRLRQLRSAYELWTGLYMLEFWEKCLFGACGCRWPRVPPRRRATEARAPPRRHHLSPPLPPGPPAAAPPDGLVSAVLILLAYGAWRLLMPVVSAAL